jgi:hypothetical protein
LLLYLSLDGAVVSRGGSVLKADDGKYHIWAASFTKNCGINEWDTNSQIVHATASAPDGPFGATDVVWPVWSHNPTVTRAPTGEYVMVFVMNRTLPAGVEFICANGSVVHNSSVTSHPAIPNINYMSTAQSPEGPWSPPEQLDDIFNAAQSWGGLLGGNTNLVISIAPTGSMTGLWRRCCSGIPGMPSKFL